MKMFDVGASDMAMIYMSPDPYFVEAFKQPVNFHKFDPGKHPTLGLSLYKALVRLYLATMSPSTPAAEIPDWRTQIRGAWLLKINDCLVTMIEDVQNAFTTLHTTGCHTLHIRKYDQTCPTMVSQLYCPPFSLSQLMISSIIDGNSLLLRTIFD